MASCEPCDLVTRDLGKNGLRQGAWRSCGFFSPTEGVLQPSKRRVWDCRKRRFVAYATLGRRGVQARGGGFRTGSGLLLAACRLRCRRGQCGRGRLRWLDESNIIHPIVGAADRAVFEAKSVRLRVIVIDHHLCRLAIMRVAILVEHHLVALERALAALVQRYFEFAVEVLRERFVAVHEPIWLVVAIVLDNVGHLAVVRISLPEDGHEIAQPWPIGIRRVHRSAAATADQGLEPRAQRLHQIA